MNFNTTSLYLTGAKIKPWRSGLFSIIAIFCLSLFITKSVNAQNTEKVIERPEISRFSKISNQIVPVVTGDSVNIAKEPDISLSNNLEKPNEPGTRNDLNRDGVVIALPDLSNQLNDFKNTSRSIQIVDGSNHQLSKDNFKNTRINNDTLFQHSFLPENKVIALPRIHTKSENALHAKESIFLTKEPEIHQFSQLKKEINKIEYSDLSLIHI